MQPVWIVGYARTGSRLLTSYLNATGLFRPFFDEWLRLEPTRVYPFSTVHSHHFAESNLSKETVEKAMPGIRYIWLRRHDLAATAVSTFIARKTGVYWAETPQEVQDHAAMPVEFDKGLFHLYREICERDRFWERYFSEGDECLTVYYEDMKMQRVFDFLEIKQSPVDPKQYLKLQHPMTLPLCQRIRERFAQPVLLL
jgi:LPS sulfotransferase NodH